MTLTTSPRTFVISSTETKVVTIPKPETGMEYSSDVSALPKYAVGLFESNGCGPRKRKRLTHLTPEEKIMRRKLKNRVAAQSARDRKRVKMESLEETVQKIQHQAEKLLECNMQLLKRAEMLEEENAELRQKLGLALETNTIVSGNRQIIEKIKVEFTEASNLDEQLNPAIPDSILSPAESSDENDNSNGFKSSNFSIGDGIVRNCHVTTECVSPRPAVFGEHEKERLIPQQQEAVHRPLIHSKVAMTISQIPLSLKKVTTTMTSSICSDKSDRTLMRTISLSSPNSQAAALDLTTRPTTPA